MTSDNDIEEYVSGHYNPNLATPEEYMSNTHWGSGERQRVAFERANEIYDAQQNVTVQEEQEIESAQEQQQEENKELTQEEEGEGLFDRASKFIQDVLRGLFGQ